MGYLNSMRILPVSINDFNTRLARTNRSMTNTVSHSVPEEEPAQKSANYISGIQFNPSFRRTAENAELMRKLFKYGMIDIHTGKPILDPDLFQEWLQKNVFSRSLRSFINATSKYEDCLHDVQGIVYKKIKQLAEKYPLYRLNDAIQKFAPEAQQELIEIQRPIFNELKEKSFKLPKEQKQAFDELMDKTEQQLENKPIPYKFSKKEFRYKLNRIAQETKQRGIAEEINVVNKLDNMASRLPYMPSGRNFSRRKPNFDADKSLSQANIIRQMENLFSRSILSEDQELNELLESAKRQVFNIPTIIPFKRKSFIHELEAIVNTIPDKKHAHKMVTTARKLPTAQEEVSAFISKSYRNSSEKIGYDLFIGSKGAIDHIIVYSSKDGKGVDALDNYAFTTIGSNSQRGNDSMAVWMRKNPTTYIGSQKCVDRLIELKQDGTLAKEGLSPWYIYTFAQRMEKQSPKEKPLILDLSELKK